MIRGVMFSLALCALLIYAVIRMVDMYQQALPERVTSVDIYSDRIDYRTRSYATPSLFAVGLKAAGEPPRRVTLHDCARMDTFETVLDIVRTEGYSNLEIVLPRDC